MSKLQGSWVWYELMAPDDAAAKAFYEAVVGWNITLNAFEGMNYGFIVNQDGGSTGGILPITSEITSNGARPAWLGYIGVDDCDAAVAAIEASGGKALIPPFDIEPARLAMVADRDGVPFYVMTPKPREDTGPSTCFDRQLPGRCAWNELQAGDQQGALDFYTKLFGWALPEPMDMGAMGKYQFVAHEDVTVGAIMPKMKLAPYPAWQFYFRVPDIDAAAKAVKENGGQVYHGPVQVPGGDWIINAGDPQHVVFGLVGDRVAAAE